MTSSLTGVKISILRKFTYHSKKSKDSDEIGVLCESTRSFVRRIKTSIAYKWLVEVSFLTSLLNLCHGLIIWMNPIEWIVNHILNPHSTFLCLCVRLRLKIGFLGSFLGTIKLHPFYKNEKGLNSFKKIHD